MSQELFPTIVGKAIIRKYGTNGLFADLECATNVKTSLNTTENTAELVCGSGETLTLEKPTGNITLTVIKTKNPELLWKILWLDVVSATAWTKPITNEPNTFEADKIELTYRSNDDNWVTSLVIKSSDGVITYADTNDYTVEVVENKTIITRVSWWSIPEWAKVLVSGWVNQNASKEVSLDLVQRVKERIEIEIFGKKEGTNKYTTIHAKPCVLDSEFILEMIDAFRDGVPTGSDLTFKLNDGANWKMRDENI